MPRAKSRSESGRTRHASRWLRDLLRSEILRDAYPEGRVPSEAELMVSYAASRQTVREALGLLRDEGLVERLQGTGTLVVVHRHSLRLVEAHGLDTAADFEHFRPVVIDHRVVPMPPAAALHLEEEPGSPCLRIDYIALLHGEPHAVATNYLRYPEAAAVHAASFEKDWYAYMARAGISIGETDLVLEAVLADEPLASELGIAVGSPVMAMEQVMRDETGRPYDFAFIRVRGDRFALFSRATRPLLPRSAAEPPEDSE